jgi:hypothetical protein
MHLLLFLNDLLQLSLMLFLHLLDPASLTDSVKLQMQLVDILFILASAFFEHPLGLLSLHLAFFPVFLLHLRN